MSKESKDMLRDPAVSFTTRDHATYPILYFQHICTTTCLTMYVVTSVKSSYSSQAQAMTSSASFTACRPLQLRVVVVRGGLHQDDLHLLADRGRLRDAAGKKLGRLRYRLGGGGGRQFSVDGSGREKGGEGTTVSQCQGKVDRKEDIQYIFQTFLGWVEVLFLCQ